MYGKVDALKRYREKVKAGLITVVKKHRPSMLKAVKEKCRDCMCDYVDGRNDCEMGKCPLYFWMPYGKLKKERKISQNTPAVNV